jgi:pimeloyl-ACP methyl ester carboxylesterase
MSEGTITTVDGRAVAFADFGPPDATGVLWCHAGPGCRLDPEHVAPRAAGAGLRLVGIDRPGYGGSDPRPGRTIAGVLPSRWGQQWLRRAPVMFAHGLEGYADDRIADRNGWGSFDITAVRCPVVVLHGGADVIADPVHARHTAGLVPHAELRIIEGLGHFSIEDEIIAALASVTGSSDPTGR